MNKIITRTFGGISRKYYLRQLFFGSVMAAFFIWLTFHTKGATWDNVRMTAWLVVFALLYPYSRFVYESIIDFLMGSNVFYANVLLMMGLKLVSMVGCFLGSIFIAPIGLLYLYYHHSKNS